MSDEIITLINDLYIKLKTDLKIYSKHEDIINLVFPNYDDLVGKEMPLFRNGTYKNEQINDFRRFSGYILNENAINNNNETYEKIRKKKIASFLDICIQKEYLLKLKDTVIILLDTTNIHRDYKLRDKLMLLFEHLPDIKSKDNELDARWFNEWVDALYYYFYYAVTDKLHSNIAFSVYPELESDLNEYNDKITLMYGVNGNPGMYQLYSMAERKDPNIIALYECGELEYYGKGQSGVINRQRAYRFYEKTRELNAVHPLATWSIAYMKFEYSLEKAQIDERYRVEEFDVELTKGSKISWYNSILADAKLSYDYGCQAAANLLGKIVDAPEKKFPASRKGMFKYATSKKFYKESADGGYVYGCNNYAKCCIDEARNADGHKKIELLREATHYLSKSAELGNPWASNKLGVYYLKGLFIDGEMIINVDREHAYKLFDFAYVMCRAENYYWPLINLCHNFWMNEESRHFKEKDYSWIKYEIKYALQHTSDNEQVKELLPLIEILNERIKWNTLEN